MTNITIKNIKKEFAKKQILKSISLDIKHEEFVVLLGPSGCGKSTLLRIIAGLETEDSGDVMLGDKRINHLLPKERELAMVFQNYAIFPHMTVAENIGFGLAMKKKPASFIDKKVKQTAELMHIEQYLDRFSGQLSGGQRQRVAVARALAMEPSLLLMDEPLSNLDALLRLEMRAELKTILSESKTTTVYVTHDQVEAMSMADRIAVMYEGEIQQYDVPDQIYHNPKTHFVGSFIGNPPMNFLDVEKFKFSFGQNNALYAGVRPENIEVIKNSEADAWTGVITVIESLGSHNQLMVKTNGENIRINTENSLPVNLGETVYLKPKKEEVRWYDDQGNLI